MKAPKQVLVIGLDPAVVDFSHFPGLDAEKVVAGLTGDKAKLNALGYDAHICLVDLGATAEAVVSQELSRRTFDCVVIGAGVRTAPAHFLLFEKLINLVHQNAPAARICFNTNPGDTAEAVQRWV